METTSRNLRFDNKKFIACVHETLSVDLMLTPPILSSSIGYGMLISEYFERRFSTRDCTQFNSFTKALSRRFLFELLSQYLKLITCDQTEIKSNTKVDNHAYKGSAFCSSPCRATDEKLPMGITM